MMPYKCFFIEPDGYYQLKLRRYASGSDCPAQDYHNVSFDIGCSKTHSYETPLPDDQRWPTHCKCGYEFKDTDEWQLKTETEYESADGNWIGTLFNLPVGAMYYAPWMEVLKRYIGPDGKSLWIMTPGGVWCPDMRASNCTRPDDLDHKCWVRHGTPPNITVDKNGNTCNAGAGSIVMRNYHGFLRNGELTDG